MIAEGFPRLELVSLYLSGQFIHGEFAIPSVGQRPATQVKLSGLPSSVELGMTKTIRGLDAVTETPFR